MDHLLGLALTAALGPKHHRDTKINGAVVQPTKPPPSPNNSDGSVVTIQSPPVYNATRIARPWRLPQRKASRTPDHCPLGRSRLQGQRRAGGTARSLVLQLQNPKAALHSALVRPEPRPLRAAVFDDFSARLGRRAHWRRLARKCTAAWYRLTKEADWSPCHAPKQHLVQVACNARQPTGVHARVQYRPPRGIRRRIRTLHFTTSRSSRAQPRRASVWRLPGIFRRAAELGPEIAD
ncbi:hypothetical protein K505DRAFT_27591 [Melanomma pulvis-pyrius CBS 109.77]|uniref:Uncharacterized protein n=1 Tax=Melanomma pulvis-pyrius CBS 109.77 TaxID=1314802 RepID=A0A6A6XDM4_9PLEO|nr:hypothetical protein K505DRAFT_27591 [Melanomma pulvis-pyrius CBS 109.77]